VAYLGLAGVAGFCWLMAVSARHALARRPVPPQALAVGWILAYASIGGVTNLLAMFAGLQIFRATNRATVFLSAIAVLWLVMGLSRLTARFPAPLRLAAALLVAVLGVLEQLPRRAPGQTEAIAQKVRLDREFGERLEAALGPSAMLFQTPMLDFPEAAPPHQLTDYEHFRPYLATDTLRFSYGSPRLQARGRWQRDLQHAPPATVVRTLESYGFAALYLNRKGFPDGGDALLRQIAQLGYDRRIESLDGEQVAVLLRPQVSPRMPLGKALTIGRGWKFRSDGAPWAYDAGTMSFFNPYPAPIRVELRVTLMSRMHRRLTLELDGEPLRSIDLPACTARLVLPSVALESGINCFRVRSREPATEHEGVSNEARAFGLAEANVLLPPRIAIR
jgi:hypothetical protein